MPFVRVQRRFIVAKIEVVLIDPDRWPITIYCELPRATVRDAISAAGLQTSSIGDAVYDYKTSIHGKKVKLSDVLVDGDRLELAPVLRVDPKLRRQVQVRKSRMNNKTVW